MRGRGRSQSLAPSGPLRCCLWPFGPDAEGGLHGKSFGKFGGVYTMVVGQDSARRSREGCRGVSRRHLKAAPRCRVLNRNPERGHSYVCVPPPSSTPTCPAGCFPSQRIPPPTAPGAWSPGWGALRTLAGASIVGRKSQNLFWLSLSSRPWPGTVRKHYIGRGKLNGVRVSLRRGTLWIMAGI